MIACFWNIIIKHNWTSNWNIWVHLGRWKQKGSLVNIPHIIGVPQSVGFPSCRHQEVESQTSLMSNILLRKWLQYPGFSAFCTLLVLLLRPSGWLCDISALGVERAPTRSVRSMSVCLDVDPPMSRFSLAKLPCQQERFGFASSGGLKRQRFPRKP